MKKLNLLPLVLFLSLAFSLSACDEEKKKENNVNNVTFEICDNTLDDDGDGDVDCDDADCSAAANCILNNVNNMNNVNNQQPCTAPPREFWNYDLTVMPPRNVQIASTCYGEGDHVYVYVADDAWADGTVDASMVANIVTAWETATPGNPDAGIFTAVTSVMGLPPDVDSDPHVVVFLSKLGSYNGTAFDGYFRRENQVPGTNSNLTEMVYIDCEHHAPDSDYLLGVLAHEFQHMISYGLDDSEEGWLDEVFSQAAMVLSGYWSDLAAGNSYLASRTGTSPLLVADSRDFSYGAGFLFASWVLDQYEGAFFGDLVSDTDVGITSFNDALTLYGETGFDLYDLILDWAAASLLNDPSIGSESRYAYLTLGDAVIAPNPTAGTLGTHVAVSMPLATYKYYEYDVLANQEIVITYDNPDDVRMLAIFRGEGVVQMLPVAIIGGEAHLTTPEWDGSWTFIVIRAVGTGTVGFTVDTPVTPT
ncbi:hypothetical protein KKD52_18195 [Myxococcota bacterium]|nr:hypothetical protein [Myxococcota bacterium]MBU1412368.1 hypothetical protein [Myxococcota bacterium]MBU1512286.1 hypothetical protein [Myxococcota bacterium]PKN22024.1 MAG: hypothetical protein CVU65_15730 [Deltaproteobacteria bacterium HGW-Deltaproteobacteria-22]